MKNRQWILLFICLGALVAMNFFVCGRRFMDHSASGESIPDHSVVDKKSKINTERVLSDLPAGRWHLALSNLHEKATSDDQIDEIKKLESLGYAAGTTCAPKTSGVTIYNRTLAHDGLNLFTSGHKPEAILMDMEGRILHQWSFGGADWRAYIPEYDLPEHHDFCEAELWRRVHLYENGDILAVLNGGYLLKLDKDSNRLWANEASIHHDLFVDAEGKIYVLIQESVIHEECNNDNPVWVDFVAILDSEGREIKRVSILECLENSPYAPLLNGIKKEGEIFHTNTIELLDGRLRHESAAFEAGNVLISILLLDTICVLDLEAKSAVWALTGVWSRQHQPTVLDNGNMLIFDNRGTKGISKVLEFDPFSQEIVWSYAGSPDKPFHSFDCGSCERLPNGNTLITESNKGRAFEVTPDHTIVWEYISPFRAGENDELIATLFEMIRLQPDFSLGWLKRRTD